MGTTTISNSYKSKKMSKFRAGQMYNYTIILKPQPEGVFTVNVPALPGCITEGRTKAEAIDNAREAIELYLETLIEDGQLPPPDIKPLTKVIHLNFAKAY